MLADPSVNENNYQDMLFKATKEIMPDSDATAIGMQAVKEEKPDVPKEEPEQVSEDLEPIGKEDTANKPVEEPAEGSTEEPAEEPTEESAEKPADGYTEEFTEEPAEKSVEEPAEPKDTFVPGSEHFDNSGFKPFLYISF